MGATAGATEAVGAEVVIMSAVACAVYGSRERTARMYPLRRHSVITSNAVRAIEATSRRLGVHPGVLGGLFELESGHRPKVWGGDGGQYFGLIQFGPGARKETGIDPQRHTSIESQLPYVESYMRQRGYDPSQYRDETERARALYRTVLVGNPRQSGTDSNGTNSDSAARRMLPGGDLFERAMARYRAAGSEVPASPRPTAANSSRLPALNSSEPLLQGVSAIQPGAGSTRKAADPLVATALAGLLPQADANPLATLQTAFQRLAGAAGTSGFGAALRHAMAPLGKLQAHGAVDDLHDQMSAAIFGTPRRMTATAGSDGAMTPFQSTRMGVSSPGTAAIEPSGNQTLRVGDGAIKVGKIASPGQDIYPTTGPHLDVRIMKNGEYINPEFARSLLQNLRVDGKPLYSQRDGQWTPAYPVTSPYGPRSAPTAGASTYHRGVDYGVPEGKELEWTGGGAYSRQPGYGQIDLPTGERIKLLHTIG